MTHHHQHHSHHVQQQALEAWRAQLHTRIEFYYCQVTNCIAEHAQCIDYDNREYESRASISGSVLEMWNVLNDRLSTLSRDIANTLVPDSSIDIRLTELGNKINAGHNWCELVSSRQRGTDVGTEYASLVEDTISSLPHRFRNSARDVLLMGRVDRDMPG